MSQKLIPYIHSDGETWDYFFVDIKTKIIQFERRMNGKKIKFSCRTDNGLKAKRFANAELEKRLGKKKVHVRTLIKAEMELWLKQKETVEELSESQLFSIRRGIRQLKPYWGNKLPSEITQDAMPEFYEWWRKNHKIQMGTALKTLKSLSLFMHRKIVNGQSLLPAVPVMIDPDSKKNRAKRAKKKDRIIAAVEFNLIQDSAANPIEALATLFMYTMATRIEETLSLDFEHNVLLDEPIPVYRWFYGSNKADLAGSHVLHQSLIEPLRKLRDQRATEGTTLVFPQKLNNQKPLREQQIDWSAWRTRAGLGWHWTPHIFRHTSLSLLFNDPRNPQALICKQYRISMKVALATYIKPTTETLLLLRDSIKVDL